MPTFPVNRPNTRSEGLRPSSGEGPVPSQHRSKRKRPVASTFKISRQRTGTTSSSPIQSSLVQSPNSQTYTPSQQTSLIPSPRRSRNMPTFPVNRPNTRSEGLRPSQETSLIPSRQRRGSNSSSPLSQENALTILEPSRQRRGPFQLNVDDVDLSRRVREASQQNSPQISSTLVTRQRTGSSPSSPEPNTSICFKFYRSY